MYMVLTGSQGSGKTRFVRSLTEGKKVIWTNPGNCIKHLRDVLEFDSEFDFIVLDECGEKLSHELIEVILAGKVRIRKPYERFASEFKTPPFILITNKQGSDLLLS